jgi:hypothetical protein
MRLFHPASCPEVLEMGSFVKSIHTPLGISICTRLTDYAEAEANRIQKPIIAITERGGRLAQHLARMKWKVNSHMDEYVKRKGESPEKQLWEKSYW